MSWAGLQAYERNVCPKFNKHGGYMERGNQDDLYGVENDEL